MIDFSEDIKKARYPSSLGKLLPFHLAQGSSLFAILSF